MSDLDLTVDLGADVAEQAISESAAVEDHAVEEPVADVGTAVEPIPAPLPVGVVLR